MSKLLVPVRVCARCMKPAPVLTPHGPPEKPQPLCPFCLEAARRREVARAVQRQRQ